MANLRKRVAAIDLTRTRKVEDSNANDTGQQQTQEQLDNRPLLPKVSALMLCRKFLILLSINVGVLL